MLTVNQVATSTNLQNKMIELYMNRLPVMRKEDHTYLLVSFLASCFPCGGSEERQVEPDRLIEVLGGCIKAGQSRRRQAFLRRRCRALVVSRRVGEASGDNGDKTCGPTEGADERCCRDADGSQHREETPSATIFWSRTAVHSHLGYERSRDTEFVDVEASARVVAGIAAESPRVHARVSQIQSCGSMHLDGRLACFPPR